MALPDSVEQKVFRAKQHYDALVRELRMQFHGHTGKVVMDADAPSDFNIVIDAELSKQVALILGDCLNNLRSSLDYLIWELVLASHSQPGKQNMFPVCQKLETFKEAKRSRLAGLSEEMIAEVEFLQPYNGGDYRERPLWLLDELNNIHKHRRLLLIKLRAAWAGKLIGTEKYAIVSRAE